MLRFIKDFPQVVSRLVDRIDSPAIQDTLLRIIACEEAGVGGVIEVSQSMCCSDYIESSLASVVFTSGCASKRSSQSYLSCSHHMNPPQPMQRLQNSSKQSSLSLHRMHLILTVAMAQIRRISRQRTHPIPKINTEAFRRSRMTTVQ